MNTISAGALDVAYLETGPAAGEPVVLLHGFPYDAHAYDEASARIAAAGMRCLTPFLRGYGPTRFRSPDAFRSGQQAALAQDLLDFMDALGLQQAVLAGYDWGGRAACVVAALHPERVTGLVTCGTPYNIQDMAKATTPVAPDKEQRYWYWYYLNSERGRRALTDERTELCRHLWKVFSPIWTFDEATFSRTAASFDNPDFVDVVLHSYRFRIGAAPGDPRLEPMERRLLAQPRIATPTIVLQGADDGVDPPEPGDGFAKPFAEMRARQILPGVGHNLPQEAPHPFADAVISVGSNRA